jgi:hypothetical protein
VSAPTIDTARYTTERTDYGYDIIDTHTGACVGVAPDEQQAATTVQRLSELHRANRVRLARAAIKREIHDARPPAASRETLAAVLEDNPPALATMRVEALLRSVRQHHVARRKGTLKYARCSESKTVGELTSRQRARLCEALRMAGYEELLAALGSL